MKSVFEGAALVAATVVALAAAVFGMPQRSFAAQDGELWEVTTQMNVPGMPAGAMGSSTAKFCRGGDPRQDAARQPDTKDCKVEKLEQSATHLTMTLSCPQGRMTLDQTYNAARTSYKGTMRMTSKEGEMVMNTAGRKVGTCDAQQARREREERVATAKSDAARYQAQAAAQRKQSEASQIQACQKALDAMDFRRFGQYSRESCAEGSQLRGIMMGDDGQKKVFGSCCAKVSDFCSRLQTEEGFLKAKGDEQAAASCGLSGAQIKAKLCPRAAEKQSLAFLGHYCPVEAKPLAQQHCAGRDYTSAQTGRFGEFCRAYLANADFEERSAKQSSSPAVPAPVQAVGKGINEGLNKLKGLFGR
jgi:hypothetical protein